MTVNSAEVLLFKKLAEAAEKNPPKPLSSQSIADFRSGVGSLSEFAGEPANVHYADQNVPARDGSLIRIRIYNHDLPSVTPVIVMYPGCGYVLDLFELNGIACSRIAKYSGIKVILVNFRLAPEYPLPQSIYDGYDATQYIATHAEQFQIDPNKIFIGGISSGAHCAAVIANLARQDKQLHIYHQVLINGIYDLTQSSTHDYDDYEKEDKINTREVITFIIKNLGIKPQDYKNPLFSPYFEPNLANLPRTTFIVGEYDGIRNDSEAYYKKLHASNSSVKRIILPGQTHNTMVMRAAMSDGEDPAAVVANIIRNADTLAALPAHSES